MIGRCVDPVDREISGDDLLEFGIERAAFVYVQLDCGGAENLVDTCVAVGLGVGPDHALANIGAEVRAVNTDHRITPVEDHVHREFEIMPADAARPCGEVGCGAHSELDADLFEL